MNKVWVIEQSLRCRRNGYWCLIPVAGIGAIATVYLRWRQIHAEVGGGWNPAAGPLRWGVALAILGSLISTVTIALLIRAILKAGLSE